MSKKPACSNFQEFSPELSCNVVFATPQNQCPKPRKAPLSLSLQNVFTKISGLSVVLENNNFAQYKQSLRLQEGLAFLVESEHTPSSEAVECVCGRG